MGSARKLIVGNWKMNGLTADGRLLAENLAALMKSHSGDSFQLVLCPPATLIGTIAATLKDSAIKWGGQDCHDQDSGAFTGDVSAPMLHDLGCSHVIVGHSERRQYHLELSTAVAAKAKAAHIAGMTAIICVGETDAQRSAGQTDSIVIEQLKASIPNTASQANTVIAYEPVWAIGTGKTASADDITKMHALIRLTAGTYPILYGGSVKASNAGEIMKIDNVDGVLVGGASLKAEEFWGIATAA